jgi:hypothetical protein
MDQLKVYSPKHDQLYFTMRFIDGLHSDIKSIILVQRPKDLDTATTLTLLQEKVGVVSQRNSNILVIGSPRHGWLRLSKNLCPCRPTAAGQGSSNSHRPGLAFQLRQAVRDQVLPSSDGSLL